jgi:hypothetical protein
VLHVSASRCIVAQPRTQQLQYLSIHYTVRFKPSDDIDSVSASKLLQNVQVYSVWPVGESLHWTWLEHTFELWGKGWEQSDVGGSILNGNRGAFFWRQEGA